MFVPDRPGGRLHQRRGGTPTRALVPKKIRHVRPVNRRWSRGGCLAARQRIGPPCPILHLAGDSHARCSPARGTSSIFGTHSGTAQRAGNGGRIYPANRHRLWIRTRSCGRRWPIQSQIGAAFGYDTRTNTLRQILLGLKSVPCTDPPLWGQTPAWCHQVLAWCHKGLVGCGGLVLVL